MLAIAGGKGGSGKTTTALGLAASLARRHDESPVVVDADLDSPDLHLLAGVVHSIDRDDECAGHLDSSDSTTFPGVSVVSAPSGSISDGRFHASLDGFSDIDCPTFVDCPAGASRAAAPLRASDDVLLTTTFDPASLRDAAKTAAMADRLGTDISGAVLTRVPSWASTLEVRGEIRSNSDFGEVRPEIIRRVERLLDVPVVGQIPEVDKSGRAVLAHPVVRTSYEWLARALRR